MKDKSDVRYFKLPYHLLRHIKIKLLKLCKEFCKENFNIQLVFDSFKKYIYIFHIKIQFLMIWNLSYYTKLLVLASSSYNSEACRYFEARIEEHIKKDNKSHIFKHLHSSETCFDSYNSLCLKIIDKTNSKFDLKIKKALHINWRKPNLNSQQNHLALKVSL